jgi:hypothetical protein
MFRFAMVETHFTSVATRLALSAAVVAAVLGSRAAVAQQQFDDQLGVGRSARETTEVVPNPEAAAGISGGSATGPAAAGSGSTTGAATYEGTSGPSTTPSMSAERAVIWNSAEMVAARDYITEYGRRSRQFSSTDATAYLARLSQFTPEEMRAWLGRYQARQAALVRNEQVSKAARQTAVEYSLGRLQAEQQAQRNASLWQTEGALAARDQYQTQQLGSQLAAYNKSTERDAYLGSMQAGNYYDYFVNPPYWVQAAAASTLPGDLPAGDPRNRMRDPAGPEGSGLSEAAAAAAERAGGKGR